MRSLGKQTEEIFGKAPIPKNAFKSGQSSINGESLCDASASIKMFFSFLVNLRRMVSLSHVNQVVLVPEPNMQLAAVAMKHFPRLFHSSKSWIILKEDTKSTYHYLNGESYLTLHYLVLKPFKCWIIRLSV